MGSFLGRPDAFDPELQPITFFKVVNAPIEREQKLEPVFGSPVIYIISCDDIILESHLPGKWSGTPSADVHYGPIRSRHSPSTYWVGSAGKPARSCG